MRLEIRMPRKSEYSDDGTIAKWLVAVGDVVAKGDPIADVEVDMTTDELLAEADGKIVEIWVHAGQSVPVETVIAMQSVEEEAVAEAESDAEKENGVEEVSDAEAPVEESVAATGETEDEFPEMSEEVLAKVPETDAADSGDSAVVQHGHVLASPSAVQLAEQYNVKLETLTGTGSCGRIEREDVEAAMQTTSQFITPEDVDDLMNFDGDFASEFSDTEQETEEQPALADEAPSTADEGHKAEEIDAGQVEAGPGDSVEEESVSDAEERAEETVADQTEESVADQTEVEMSQPSEESVSEQSEDVVADETAQEGDDEATEESVTKEAEEQPIEDEEQPPEPDSESSDEIVSDEGQKDEAGELEGADAEPSVIYMGAGPETMSTDPEDEAISSEEAPDGTDTIDESTEEESQEVEISVEVQADEESEEEVAESSGEAEDVSEQEAETLREEADEEESAALEEPVASAVSAYEPTVEERESVIGFSTMSGAETESDALAIDESDTIESEEADNIESAVEEELAADPEPVKLDESTVETAIEQATAEESRKSIKIRRLVARKMEQSWQHAPHFFVTVAVDMTDVIRFRSDLGVTINDFILAATTRALQEHPWVNSHFVDDEAVEQPEVNISLAVETEQGLFYPVIKDCGGKSVKDLGIAAAELVVKTHSGKLTDAEMDNGSFTISNMGMLGVESFSAIITPPQVAVLAVGTVRGEVVIDEHEEMTMAPMVRLTLSADHRALDGADAADFLGTMKSYLEAPITLVASQED